MADLIRFKLSAIKENATGLDDGLKKIAQVYRIPLDDNQLGAAVVRESLAMIERLRLFKQLAEAKETEALMELAVWSVIE